MRILLCGPGGSGKTTLVNQLRSQVKEIRQLFFLESPARKIMETLHLDQRSLDNQQNVLKLQQALLVDRCSREAEHQSFISDRNIIDSLAYAWYKIDEQAAFQLVNGNPIVKRTLGSYKSALVVVVSPLSECENDGTRIVMSHAEGSWFNQIIRTLLDIWNIPYLDLRSVDRLERCRVVTEAVWGTVPLWSSTLDHYKTNKKNKHAKQEQVRSDIAVNGRNSNNSLPFFLDPKAHDQSITSIPTIEIKEHESTQDFTYFKDTETNRFTAKHGSECLFILSFHRTVKSNLVVAMLRGGIRIRGVIYSFLGCSSSGLKARKCYLWRGSSNDVDAVLAENGQFDNIKTTSKRMARYGLLFSAVKFTKTKLYADSVVEDVDFESDNGRYNFSDGCGGVSFELARKLYSELEHTVVLEKYYLPSVYQVRFQGYKGVLALDRQLVNSSIRVRPSMKKFETSAHPYICVCGFSKPYMFGHLNKQYLTLLSGLGVPDEVFFKKQSDHLNRIKNMASESECAVSILQWQNKFDMAKVILNLNKDVLLDSTLFNSYVKGHKDLHKCVTSVQEKLLSETERLRILITKSRNIYGVCDPVQALQYGQCFVRLTIKGVPHTLRGQVIVSKNPCYLLGDVRVLTAISDLDNPNIEKLNHLVDCIVFPSQGKRPHSDEIAGSDLDGDMYFVCWDPDLIPPSMRPPYDYPAADIRPQGLVTVDTMIQYFSIQNRTSRLTSTVDRYFNEWAALKGVSSVECERLGQLFSRVIDAAKTGENVGIPDGLVPPVTDDLERTFVWSKMQEKAKEFKLSCQKAICEGKHSILSIENVSYNFVLEFIKEDHSNVSEYERLDFAWKHVLGLTNCYETVLRFVTDQYIDHINFGLMSSVEKLDFINRGIPRSVVLNALNKSRILSKKEIEHFKMEDCGSPWKFLFSASHADFDWSYLVKAVSRYHYSLVVLRLPDEVVIVLQFLEPVKFESDQTVHAGTVSAFFYSRHFGYNLRYILGSNYTADVTDCKLQLYRQEVRNTFLWMKASDGKIPENEICHSVSMDLTRFNKNILISDKRHPLINKVPFTDIEVFVQDDESRSYLDILEINFLETVQEVEEQDDIDEADEDLTVFFVEAYERFCNSPASELESAFELSVDFKSPKAFLESLIIMDENCPKPSEKVVNQFANLLDLLVQKVTPRQLPDSVKYDITCILTLLNSPLTPLNAYITIIVHLSRLFLHDLTHQMVQRPFTGVVLSELLSIVEEWKCWWFLPFSEVNSLITNIIDGVVTTGERYDDNSVSSIRIRNYVTHFSRLHVLAFGEEAKERKGQSADYNCDSPDCISGLKVDNYTESAKKKDEISFYRLGALSHRTGVAIGQFVLITRQADYNRLNTWESGCCVGQVASVRQAPFSISVVPSIAIPDVLDECLNRGKVRLWRLNLMTNVIAYKRIASALSSLGQSPEHFGLAPLLAHPVGHISGSPLAEDMTKIQPSGDCSSLLSGKPSTSKEVMEPLTTEEDLSFKALLSTPVESAHSIFEESAAVDIPGVQSTNDVLANGQGVVQGGDLTFTQETILQNLNKKQQDAVTAALTFKFTLIQGPPGTGKTTVACAIIEQAHLLNRFGCLLVCTETNIAVDNITRRLINNTSLIVVRVGSGGAIAKDLFDVSLEGQLKRLAEEDNKKFKVMDELGREHLNNKLVKRIIKSADVILTTCIGAKESSLDKCTFKFVLVDEATQTMETTLLCTLSHGCSHLVLIGDPKQLGPRTVKQQSSDGGQPTLALSTTLFHRMFEKLDSYFLDVQHRMHPELMAFPSKHFYNGQLRSGVTANARPPPLFPWPNKQNPQCFIHIDGLEKRQGTSLCNVSQSLAVFDVLGRLFDIDERLRELRMLQTDIGILALYSAQVRYIKDLTRKLYSQVEVNSIDGFQGREKEVIIVSTVRSNSSNTLGFSDDRNRLNVLLTRARRGLIIIGDRNTLAESEVWAAWLEQAPTLDISQVKFDGDNSMSDPHGPRPATLPHGPRPVTLPHGPRPATLPHGPRPATLPHGPRPATLPHGPRDSNGSVNKKRYKKKYQEGHRADIRNFMGETRF